MRKEVFNMITDKDKKICDIILDDELSYDEVLKTKEDLMDGLIVLYIDDYEDYDILEYLFNVKLDREEENFFEALADKPDYVNPPLDEDDIVYTDSTDLLKDLGINKNTIWGTESDDFVFRVEYYI